MNVQFVSNKKGKVTAEATLPAWKKELLDERLAAIDKNPSRLKPIEGLLAELDR